ELTAYGIATYTSPTTGKAYAFVTQRDGDKVAQLELFEDGTNKVNAEVVRVLQLPVPTGDPEESQSEGSVVDRELGFYYVALEDVSGVLKFDAEPTGGITGTLIQSIDEPYFQPDLEGLTIYYGPNGTGYILVSSQGNSTFVVLDRQPPHAYLGSFIIADNNGIDQDNESDGADVLNVPLGDQFPAGLLVVQDGANDPQDIAADEDELENRSTNFKYVPWQSVANAFDPPLLIDTTSYNPHAFVFTSTVRLESDTDSVVVGNAVTFTATVVPPLISGDTLVFDFGDGVERERVIANGKGGTFTATYVYTSTGTFEVTVTPFEQGVYELESASVTVAVTPAPIAALDVSSADLSLPADGVSSTTITAEATDVYGNSIEGAEVTFSTTAGTLDPLTATTNSTGIATTTLTAGTVPGVATVTATADDISASTDVEFIEPIDGISLQGVTIDGPASGSANVPYSFTANITPTNATGPISYTWSPMPSTGQGTATATASFTTPGQNTIMVEASAGDVVVSDTLTIDINRTTIGATGGTLTVLNADGEVLFSLDVPAGALDEETVIEFTELPTPTETLPEDFSFAGRAFTLDASQQGELLASLTFQQPVTVTLRLADDDRSDPDLLRLYRYDEEREAWVNAAVGAATIEDGYIVVPIDHLTEFSLVQAPRRLYLPIVVRETTLN
ncbi:MAG: phytase, partial [Chloroflexaceae bacterium]|nr:phytase [Chloroflexaceae bacterium]